MTVFRNKFHPGQVIQHRLFDYRGVVVDVDPTFQLADRQRIGNSIHVFGDPASEIGCYFNLPPPRSSQTLL